MAQERFHRGVREHSLLRRPRDHHDMRGHTEVLWRVLQGPQDVQPQVREGGNERVTPDLVKNNFAAKGHIQNVVAQLLLAIQPTHDLRVLRALSQRCTFERRVVKHAHHDGVRGARSGVAARELRQRRDDLRVGPEGGMGIGLERPQPHRPASPIVEDRADEPGCKPDAACEGVQRCQCDALGDLLASVHGADRGICGPWRLEHGQPHLRAEGDADRRYTCSLAQDVEAAEGVATAHHIGPEALDLGKGCPAEGPTA
mmetsp:Transcript_20266/g.58773  ORF Transcript_20266/g.58773 Transcript_20266/m.58773 type:complete len:257 (-) Transcript_20266:401-1171(-)